MFEGLDEGKEGEEGRFSSVRVKNFQSRWLGLKSLYQKDLLCFQRLMLSRVSGPREG